MIAETATNRIASGGKIYGAIIAAKREVGAVGKNATTDQRGGAKYDYRKFDDVIDAVAPLMDRFGLVVVSRVLAKEERQDGNKHFVTLTMGYTMFSEDGSFIEASQVGEAFDVGDKAATKAQTVALRIFYCTTFNIPYNEMQDPESGTQHQWVPPNESTYSRLVKALDFMADIKQLRPTLNKAIASSKGTLEDGSRLTKPELMKSIEAFSSAARRLRLSEPAVQKMVDEIKAAATGERQQKPQESTTATGEPSQANQSQDAQSQDKPPAENQPNDGMFTAEPVRYRELDLDFGMAKSNEDRERLIVTLCQSVRAGHVSADELTDLVDKYCPENNKHGFASFFLSMLHKCENAAQIGDSSSMLQQAIQEKEIGKDAGIALSQFAQWRMDSFGGTTK